MKRKIVTLMLIGLVALNTTACGFNIGKSAQKSDTGVVTETVVNNKVKLNHVEYEFPDNCTIKTKKFTKPVGISFAQVKQDGEIIGALADGIYSEKITEENFLDAANVVVKEVHGLEEDITIIDESAIVKTPHLNIIGVQLDDGIGYFIAKLGTTDFVYVLQSENDDLDTMSDAIKDIVKTFGGEEDFEMLDKKSQDTTSEDTEKAEETTTSDENVEVKNYTVKFLDGDYSIAIPKDWKTDQYDYSFYTRPSDDLEVSYADSCIKVGDEKELQQYYNSLADVYGEMTPITLTIPCQDGTTLEAYAFTVPQDGFTKTKILEPVKTENGTFSTYLEITIADFTGSVNFAEQDINVFTTYASQYLCYF